MLQCLHQQLALHDWILQRSIPLVAELTPSNFPIYETRALPMVILFLDLVSKSDRAAGDGRGDNQLVLRLRLCLGQEKKDE